MIRWYVSPNLLSDADLLREYGETTADDDRVSALLAEIKRRALEVESPEADIYAGAIERRDLDE